MGSDEDFRQMVTAVTAARMKPVIDSVHPPEEIRQATERMEAANQFGRIVLRMSD